MNFFLKILLSIAIFLTIASFGFPLIVDIFLIFFIIKVFHFNFLSLLILELGFVSIFLLGLIISSSNPEKNFYRSHEKFFTDKYIYKKNINHNIEMPHGDIVALEYCNTNINIAQPRQQEFITDKLGFRNNKYKIEEADILLVGDSQITGTSNTQEFIPANVLSKISNYKVYTLSVIGGPQHYEHYIKEVLGSLKKDIKIYVFYTEGSDFEIEEVNNDKNYIYWNGIKMSYLKHKFRFAYERLERNKDKVFVKRLNKLYQKNYFYKKIRPKSQRLIKEILAKWTNSCPVEYYSVLNKSMGFYFKPFSNNITVDAIIFSDKSVLDKIKKIIYLPQKYTIYGKILNSDFETNYKIFQFLEKEYRKLGIDTLNLTDVLQKSAKEHMEKNELIFWRVDTHWNRLGILSAMKYLNKNIN